ncbi:FtsW/RodA/SpoVE family cell cycle protein [candidate division KSB1 bacterium]
MKKTNNILVFSIFLYLLLGLIKVRFTANQLGFLADDIFFMIYAASGLVFILIFFFLKILKYRGSYIIFLAALFIIFTGFIVQYSIDSRQITTRSQTEIKNTGEENQTGMRLNSKYESGVYKKESIVYLAGFLAFLVIITALSKNVLILYHRYLLFALFTLVGFFAFVVFSKAGSYGGRFFQNMTPWEIFKITLSIVIAGYLYDYGSDLNKTRFGIPVLPVHSTGPLVLLWVTPLVFLVFIHDFGQLLIYSVLAVIMIFYASKRFAYIFISLFILITFTVGILNFSNYLPGDLKYINKRFDTWAHFWDKFPAEEEIDSLAFEEKPEYTEWRRDGWQVLNSYFAISEGGVLGKGFGLGNPNVIPLVKNDFIFAAILEEMGFFGGFLIILFFMIILYEGIKITFFSQHQFLKYLSLSLTLIFIIQVFIHIGGVVKFIPLTGVTLPLMSKGGFSFITSLSIIALLMAISHFNYLKSRD